MSTNIKFRFNSHKSSTFTVYHSDLSSCVLYTLLCHWPWRGNPSAILQKVMSAIWNALQYNVSKCVPIFRVFSWHLHLHRFFAHLHRGLSLLLLALPNIVILKLIISLVSLLSLCFPRNVRKDFYCHFFRPFYFSLSTANFIEAMFFYDMIREAGCVCNARSKQKILRDIRNVSLTIRNIFSWKILRIFYLFLDIF